MPPWSFVFGMLGWLLPDFGHHHLQNKDNKTRRWVPARAPPDVQVSQKFKYVGWLRGEQRTLVLGMSAIYSAVKGIQVIPSSNHFFLIWLMWTQSGPIGPLFGGRSRSGRPLLRF